MQENKMSFSYPENFNSGDHDVFYFVGQEELLPAAKVKVVSGLFNVVRGQKITGVALIKALFSVAAFRKKVNIIREAAWITNQFSANYFHWINDVLPKLVLLEKEGIKCPVLLNSNLAGQQYVQETLSKMGWDYLPISLDTYCKIERLYVPGMTAGEGSQHPCYFSTVCERLGPENRVPRKKIFISRKDSPYRNVIPSAEFEKLLQANGFEIVLTDGMSLTQQIALFSQCSHLIAVHGAGLTNMAFMPPGSKVLEIRRSDDRLNYCYFKMANVLQHKYYYFLAQAECISKKIQMDNVIVDMPAFATTLHEFLRETPVRHRSTEAELI
jgi:capsular polysaccharide biosynthesis protein